MAAVRRGSATTDRSGHRIAGYIATHPRAVIGLLVLITAALSLPMVFWVPEETASQSPATQVTEAQELAAERFASDTFEYFLLVEATGGDVLDREALVALFENSAALRSDPVIGDYLVRVRDPALGIDVDGLWTIADSADQLLRGLGIPDGIAGASDDQLDGIISAILDESQPSEWGLAAQTVRDDDGVWHSPALFVLVATDNEKLGGGGFLVTIGTDSLVKEHFARDLRDAIAGDGVHLEAWAPASDVNLTSTEQGELAGPFIGLTIAAVLLVVGIAFRSYWAVAIAGAALGMLMVWLRGGANLAGFKSDQILSTILPISIISFGIDSAFHGIGRVREEQQNGHSGRRAFVIGLGSVLGALALAATSDAAAFLANTTAGIESVVQFGFAAALATASAFLLLGVATPLMLSVIEGRVGAKSITSLGKVGDLAFSLVAAGLATTTVLFLVFLSVEIGLALLVAYVLLALWVPFVVARRDKGRDSTDQAMGRDGRRLGRSVATVAGRPWVTIAVASLVTGGALWAAFQLEVTFDVNDFFSPDSDFVVALDKTAEYLGDQGGEPALVYVETDLTSPEAVEAIRLLSLRVAAADDNPLAVDATGAVRVGAGVLDVVDAATGDGSDRSGDDLFQIYDEALVSGVRDTAGDVVWTPNEVATAIWRSDDLSSYSTVLTYQIPDTRDQENVVRTRQLLEPLAADLERALVITDPDSRVVVTGSAVYRDDQLAGIRRAMLLALPIAVLACFVVALVFMRSFRYALVSVIPILLVVAWLYGFMYQAGYSINVVTSIIGAVSVGIGIDFSTHFTMRFLEERRGGLPKDRAIAAAGAGTGLALFGSAATSIAGFGALAFAPMPMFASYGLLTAIMIALALVASLYVLPSLLSVVTGDGQAGSPRVVDLRSGSAPIRIALARDVSEVVVDHLLATFEESLRDGEVTIATVPGAAIPGLVADGTADVGVAVQWPGAPVEVIAGVEYLPLIREEIVAVGAAGRVQGDVAPLVDLAHGLLIGGPHAESEEGMHRLLRAEAQYPVLAHTVPDVLTGLRLAAITGGAILLPRSMAGRAGVLPVRSLEPEGWLDTVLLVNSDRSADQNVFDFVVALSKAVDSDDDLHLEDSVRFPGRQA